MVEMRGIEPLSTARVRSLLRVYRVGGVLLGPVLSHTHVERQAQYQFKVPEAADTPASS